MIDTSRYSARSSPCLILRVTSQPVIRGIMLSNRISAGRKLGSFSSASTPSEAVSVEKPSFDSIRSKISTFVASSSTIRILSPVTG